MTAPKEYEFCRQVKAEQFKGDKESIKRILELTAPSDVVSQYTEAPREVIVLRVLGETLTITEGDWVVSWKATRPPYPRFYDVIPESMFVMEYRELPISRYECNMPF